MDDKGKRYREEEFQQSKEQLARFNQEMEKVTPKPTPRRWIR
jgi:peptide methionine sulfoxide reductase MsrA